MSSIIPIPTSRVGDLFVQQRLVDQIQNDQLSLFRLQNQISTGQRLQLPSDDPPAALRAINLQRLLDRKAQIETNIRASNSYLSAAESNLDTTSTLLANIRGDVVGVAGTLSSDADRQTLVQQIDQAMQTLLAAGNAKSQGRYLFAGSRSQDQPYELSGQHVQYSGNEGVLRSYVAVQQLFDTNLAGSDVFGGISSQIRGVELNPQLTADTLLSTINGGNGISRNAAISVSINTGLSTKTSVIDLSHAVTLGDVARLIELGAPAGTEIIADVTGQGLTLQTETGMTISVAEVAEGQAARQLGILTPSDAVLGDTLTGLPLNAAVLKTTRLESLLGTRAQGRIVSTNAANNDIVITATKNGAEFNGVQVVFVDNVAVVAGSETAAYDAGTQTLTVQVDAGNSTAAQVAAAITAEGTFTAVVDYHDALSADEAGTNPVEVPLTSQATSGGSGEDLDTSSGLILTNGGQSLTLDTSTAETVEDLLNLISGAGLGLSAEINATRDGINVRSRLSGADFTIGENGGTTATQLGIRTYTGDTALADFNRGIGVPTATDPIQNDLLITARDGTTQLSINLSTATTVQDVIDLINNNPANNAIPPVITARLALTGNGIELVDSSVGVGANTLTVQTVEGSQAAQFLGFVADGQTQSDPSSVQLDGAGNQVLTSQDRHTLETDSVFNTLLRLKSALQQNDSEEIGRSLERLDADINRVNFARSEIGSRMQSLDTIGSKLKDENVQLKSALSDDMDVDLVEAISSMTARQYAFQASLQTAASVLKLSLLDFI